MVNITIVDDIEISEEFKQEPIFDEYPGVSVTPSSSPVDYYFFNDHNYAKLTISNQNNVTNEFQNDGDKSATRRPYKCDKCSKDYKIKANLTNHIKIAHGNLPYLSCAYCSYTTKQKSSLYIHILGKHEELFSLPRQRYTCNVCNKIYKGKEGLNKHWRIIHGTAPSYFCDYCSYSTKYKSQHIMHVRLVHDPRKEDKKKKIEKLHKCDECNRSYTRRTSLWQHRKFACGKKPGFFCEFCDYSCLTKSQLVCHMKNRHLQSDVKAKFECTKCKRLYKFKSSLVRHLNFQCKQ